jgi:glycine betaine/proline transport system substrate-binding protein
MTTRKIVTTGALVGVTALALAGCVASTAEVASGDAESKGSLTIPAIAGWDEGIASSELWKAVLEEQGYSVDIEYADAAAVYAGLAAGDYDFFTDTWLPVTHESYFDKLGDDLDVLGTWNEDAQNHLAVNADAPIDSIAELAAHAAEFGNTIVGTDPGAGLTTTTSNVVIPTYGLEGMEYSTSSSAAMLSELDAAMSSGENIVVTLWEPHWAYDQYDLKNLEDPENTHGAHGLSRGSARGRRVARGLHDGPRPPAVARGRDVREWRADRRLRPRGRRMDRREPRLRRRPHQLAGTTTNGPHREGAGHSRFRRQSRVSLRCVVRCGRAASGPRRSILLAS